MNTLPGLFHHWDYVIASYGLVSFCCIILAVSAYIRFKRSLSRLHSIERMLEQEDGIS